MTLKGTVGTSLMNLFKPVLVMVNNAIVVINQFAKAVGDSLGKILGWRYEVGSGAVALDDAADYAEDLEGGLGGAGKVAKDLKRQLQGFDELNNLTSNDPSGGGGGGLRSLPVFRVVRQRGGILRPLGVHPADSGWLAGRVHHDRPG